jgi:CubicO group peptidase (beta-lactamase class C family)
MRFRLRCILHLVVVSTAAAQERSPGSVAVPPSVVAAVRQYMDAQRIPGLSIAVGQGSRVVWAEGFGSADLEHQIAVTPTTLFLLQSTQKILTATAVLRLAQLGKLMLDDPVQRYCPAFGVRPWPVTLRQLLSHQGGIRQSDLSDLFNQDHYVSTEAALRRFSRDSLQVKPGTQVVYSNAGYTLLACAIEGATRQPYDSALAHLVLEPAGMRATRSDNVYEVVPERARYYVVRTGANTEQWKGLWTAAHLASTPLDRPANADPVDPSWAIGAGNYLGTPADLVRFGMALTEGLLLRGSYRDSSFVEARLTETQKQSGRALGGWSASSDGVFQMLGSSWNGSFALAIKPSSGVVVAVGSNIEFDQPADLLTRIIDAWSRTAPGQETSRGR